MFPLEASIYGGRKRSVNVREVLNGIFLCVVDRRQWKALPKDLPLKSTVHDYLELWNWDGSLERIHHTLYVAQREEEGLRRGQEGQGSQAAHLVDTLGLLLNAVVHPPTFRTAMAPVPASARRRLRLAGPAHDLVGANTVGAREDDRGPPSVFSARRYGPW